MEMSYIPGDVIQDYCEPFVKILKDAQKGKRCDHCFKSSHNLQRCGNCRLMSYCSKSCQKKDWKRGHGFECKSDFFKKPIHFALQPSDFKRQLCRLLAVLKLNPESSQKKFAIYNGSDRCFDDLLSHQMELKKDIRFLLFCQEMARDLEKEGNYFNSEENVNHLLHLAGVWKTNGFSILNEDDSASIGSGIFIEPSVFNHSCKPTALYVTQGCKLQIRAVGPIAKGETPFISYLAGHKTKNERCALLMERYNFECKCERCEVEKTEDLIDYDQLKRLITLSSNQYNWKEYLKTNEKILGLMRKVYHEYDERITNRCFLIFQEAGPMGAPYEVTKKLTKAAEEHIRNTFGTQCNDYRTLLMLM